MEQTSSGMSTYHNNNFYYPEGYLVALNNRNEGAKKKPVLFVKREEDLSISEQYPNIQFVVWLGVATYTALSV